MKRLRVCMVLSLLFISSSQFVLAGEKYKGDDPPSIQILQQIVSRISKDATILGLHKERDGAFLVITNVDPNWYGGPYKLLRLETKEWVIHNSKKGTGGAFEFVEK